MAGKGEGGTNQESSIDIYTVPCVKKRPNGRLLCSSAQCFMMACRCGMGGGGEGGNTCVHGIQKKLTQLCKQLYTSKKKKKERCGEKKDSA